MSLLHREITLGNSSGMVVRFPNFGARVSSIKIPVNGQLEEMIVTYNEPKAFIDDSFHLGAT